MNKAKEILQKHTRSNGCKLSLQENPFLEQAILNAINEAINYSPCCKSDSELLICDTCKSGLIDYPEINRRTCRCGALGYNVTD